MLYNPLSDKFLASEALQPVFSSFSLPSLLALMLKVKDKGKDAGYLYMKTTIIVIGR